MGRLDDLGDADGWRCWLCDQPVDPDMSVNDPRGPSADAIITAAKSKGAKHKGRVSPVGEERLAHRACNTKKGAVAPEVPWADELFVVDPAPILASVERLDRKGGREIMARCPTADDAEDAAAWLVDRLSRLTPALSVRASVEPGGGQFLLVLSV
ncbi:MAG: hypothetical protein M3Y51_01050 [Actinomycetota bacterium]|nr:hypothetical protein [Actinomycetota bacterium]